MIPGPFSYHRPATVADAVNLLSTLGDEARPLAGGHSLVPMMKLRLASPEHLVDLHGVAGLKATMAESMLIFAPSSPKVSAMRRLMPLLPPVTKTDFPLNKPSRKTLMRATLPTRGPGTRSPVSGGLPVMPPS